jgi:hypothetical protein
MFAPRFLLRYPRSPPLPCKGSNIASRRALKVAGRLCRHGVRCRAWCVRILSNWVRASYVFRPLLRISSGPAWSGELWGYLWCCGGRVVGVLRVRLVWCGGCVSSASGLVSFDVSPFPPSRLPPCVRFLPSLLLFPGRPSLSRTFLWLECS